MILQGIAEPVLGGGNEGHPDDGLPRSAVDVDSTLSGPNPAAGIKLRGLPWPLPVVTGFACASSSEGFERSARPKSAVNHCL